MIDNNIRVSNNSWGTSAYSQSLYDAIQASQAVGHVLVASAGNTTENIDDFPHYPASFDLPNIISVAATDNDDALALFPSGNTSCYGPTSVDLGAPGLFVYSTVPGPAHGYKSGTSMAAPHVTGTVALIMSRRTDWTWSEVKDRVLGAVRPVDSLIGITVTGGVVNAKNVGDCNDNGIADEIDIADGTSEDCSGNGIPDECEPDCNNNDIADRCDIADKTSEDCNSNGVPDECEQGGTDDCNGNGNSDLCDLFQGLASDCNTNNILDVCDIANGTSEDCNTNSIPDECEPDCNGNQVSDDCDIAHGTSEDCSGNGIPDECEPDCNENEVADSCDILDGTSDDDNGNGVPDECAIIFYVDDGAIGLNNGSSWVDAFTDLEDAMASAAPTADVAAETQIWVAQGRYVPTSRTDSEEPRSATFQLLDYVSIYGGFGGSESRLDERDVHGNVTILSGDLNGDDGPDFANSEENAYHIVSAYYTGPLAILDGFTMTHAHAYYVGISARERGGGVYAYGGSPTVTNCVFVENRAFDAAGMINIGGAPRVINCLFLGNHAGRRGGGYYCSHGDPVLTNCVFSGNTAGDDPGYWGSGGGMYATGTAQPRLSNCVFVGNEAFGEPAFGRGGGIAIANYSSEYHVLATLASCILWENHDSGSIDLSAQMSHDLDSVYQVDYSCIQGWTVGDGGTGIINVDPAFADPGGSDDTLGTIDDNLRLTPSSPCIDAGDNLSVPSWVTTDLDGLMRFVDLLGTPDTGNGTPPIVDMGAYEYRMDCNGNGISDESDIATGTSQDCNENTIPDECEGDLPDADGDGVFDECDDCPYEPALSEPSEPGYEMTCDDEIDNDCDGVTDASDLDCSCELVESPLEEPGGVEKNRYIAFTDANPDCPTAVRVRFVDLPAPFDVFNDQAMWIGEPREVTENAGYVDPADVPGWPTFWTATLQCEPHYKFWGTDTVHIYHELIVPGGRYEVQAIDPACDTAAEEDYSLSFEQRNSIWGDLVENCATTPCGPPDGIVNVTTDVTAVLDKYKNLTGAVSKVRADIEGCAVGSCPVPDQVINITDVSYSLNAFLGETYPPPAFPEPSVPPACPP